MTFLRKPDINLIKHRKSAALMGLSSMFQTHFEIQTQETGGFLHKNVLMRH